MGVTKDSPADRGGLKAGDSIVKFGESRVGGLEDFDNALRKFKAGEYHLPCALIIGTRTESTDRKVSLNAALRDFGVSV